MPVDSAAGRRVHTVYEFSVRGDSVPVAAFEDPEKAKQLMDLLKSPANVLPGSYFERSEFEVPRGIGGGSASGVP